MLARVGGHWKGLDDLEIETCGRVSWFNAERFHGELADLTPAETEHADPRTTTGYDRRLQDFDKHAAYVVVAFIAGA